MLERMFKLFRKENSKRNFAPFSIQKMSHIENSSQIMTLWNIYKESFAEIDSNAPCQQSIKSLEEFKEDMARISVLKYLLLLKESVVGFGMITNDISNCTWISESYFERHYAECYHSGKLYYFMGICIDRSFRGIGGSTKILNFILNDLPSGSVMGFDHSYSVNRFIPYFTKLIRGRKLTRKYLDKQVYYVVKCK